MTHLEILAQEQPYQMDAEIKFMLSFSYDSGKRILTGKYRWHSYLKSIQGSQTTGQCVLVTAYLHDISQATST